MSAALITTRDGLRLLADIVHELNDSLCEFVERDVPSVHANARTIDRLVALRDGLDRGTEDAARDAVSRAIFARMWSERPHDFGPAFEHDKDLCDRAADDAIRALREAGG